MGKFVYIVIGSLLLLLFSCAQVGSISGGPKDNIPPTPVLDGIQPPIGSLQFNAPEITLRFDEYVKLNNPLETISMVPADAKVTASVHKKTVKLTLNGNLKPKTTYAIYLNGAIKDITEGNDSLIQYVFSTGDYIDTLMYSGFVSDAYTYQPLKDVLVGLYQLGDSALMHKPAYFSKSDMRGKFTISYIKAGTYQVLAFEDQNKDLVLQPTERMAFASQQVTLTSNRVDSLPLRVFAQPAKPIVKAYFQGPSMLRIAANYPLDSAQLRVNGINYSPNFRYDSDSLAYLIEPVLDASALAIQVSQHGVVDSLRINLYEKDRLKKITAESNLVNGTVPIGKNVVLRFSDAIQTVNEKAISFQNKDSLKLNFTFKVISPNSLELVVEKNDSKDLYLKLLSNSISFKSKNEFNSLNLDIKQNFKEELGTIILLVDSLPKHAIVHVLKGKSVVETFPVSQHLSPLRVENLPPETYTFSVVIDSNQNGIWDAGNFKEGIQPEEILYFSKGIKVRPNWEMEVSLIPENR